MTLLGLSKLLADNRQIEQPHLEALNLLEIVSRLPQSKLLAGDFQLTGEQTSQLGRLIRLRRHLPLAYLRGEKEFYGLAFHVNACTLIPRPESEDLVSLALERRRHFKNVYDVGAGSGCLGISYAHHSPSPSAQFHFIDRSAGALAVAQKNCRRHEITAAHFIHQNIYHLEEAVFEDDGLILANLPYLDHKLRQRFERACPELQSEPAEALFAGGGGIEFYQQLFKLCRQRRLTLVCESLVEQQPALEQAAASSGFRLRRRLNLASLFT